MAARECLGDEVRLVLRVELVAEILDVTLDGPRCNAQLLRALFRREPGRDAPQHLELTLGQADEIFLLPRKIHHRLRTKRPIAPALLIGLVIPGLQ